MVSKYSIKELERLSGIKAHTIRIWEQRYQIIKPKRTDTNIRYYEDDHLKKILNVANLVKNGMKISKVANLSESSLKEAILDNGNYNSNYDKYVSALKIAMIDYDEELFSSIFDKCIGLYGIDETLVNVLGVFLQQIGDLWLSDSINITNEHFVSNLVKQKLFFLVDQLVIPKTETEESSFILYLPSGELHELSLLYIYYVLKKKGFRAIYLGQSVPIKSLVAISEKTGIKKFVSIFTSNPHETQMFEYLENFKAAFGSNTVSLHCAGSQLKNIEESELDTSFVSTFPNIQMLAENFS